MRIGRGDLHDFYAEDGRSVVMVGDEVIVLSELATSIVLSVPESGHTSLASVTHEMLEEFGPPEPPHDAATVLLEHVHDLAAHQILVIEAPATSELHASPHISEATEAVREAMRTVLTSNTAAPWALAEDLDSAFLQAVRRQRVACQLALGLHQLGLSQQLRSSIRRENDELRAACVPLVRQLHQVLDVLESVNVRCLLFKGVALAAQAWGDEFARGYGDLDLLVSPKDLVRAHNALTTAQWDGASRHPTPGQGWAWEQFIRFEHELTLSSGSTDLDLHWYPSLARSSFPSFERLWARRDTVSVLGRDVATFSPYDALAHSASHSARDHWRWLRGIADVHRLMSRPDTWLGADRPLRHDQLMTVGVAGHLLGIPDGAPPVVHEAMRAGFRAKKIAVTRQAGPEHEQEAARRPGVNLGRSLASSWRARPQPSDHARAVIRTVTPPAMLAQEQSRSAVVGFSRIVERRAQGWLNRL